MAIANKMVDNVVGNTDGWRLLKQSDNHIWFCFGAIPGTGYQGSANGCAAGSTTTARSATAVVPGTWYHVAGVYSPLQRLSIYVNGVLDGTASGVNAVDSDAAPMLIGFYPFGQFATLMYGQIDEVQYYDQALSAAEIRNLAGQASTSTNVSCSPPTVGVGQPTSCTATVTDTGSGTPTTPTGAVSFSSDSPGGFSSSTCTLSGSGTTASCQVSYTPSSVGSGSHTITASYSGDSAHAASSGTTTVTVKGAAEQLADLYKAVQGIGPGTSLSDKVALVQSYLASGDVADACGTLRAFVNQVKAQSGKSIPTDTAQQLIADAQRIQARLWLGVRHG